MVSLLFLLGLIVGDWHVVQGFKDTATCSAYRIANTGGGAGLLALSYSSFDQSIISSVILAEEVRTEQRTTGSVRFFPSGTTFAGKIATYRLSNGKYALRAEMTEPGAIDAIESSIALQIRSSDGRIRARASLPTNRRVIKVLKSCAFERITD